MSIFKAYDAKEQLEKELENREKEIYSLKHDLIDARMEKDNLMKRIQELEGELQNEKKQLKQSASVAETAQAGAEVIRNEE